MTITLNPRKCPPAYARLGARLVVTLATCLCSITAVLGTAPSSASAAVTCDRVASTSGSDSNSGTVSSPFLTVQKLVDSLSSGQTGCLRAGKYGSGVETEFSTPGITITSYPGEHAIVAGFPYISGAGETLSNLDFDLDKTGDSWPALCQGAISGGAQVTYGLDIEGDNITLTHSNIYVDPSIPMTNRGDGIGVGWSNQTSGDVISNNRIHDVGFCPVEEHGIYLNKTAGVQVYGNWIYDIPAGTGIQLWDGPTNAHVYNNVINNTSSCVDIGGNTPVTAGNVIEHNICSNMHGVPQPYASYCNSPGPGCTGPDPGAPLFDEWGTGTAGSGNSMQNNVIFCSNSSTCTTSFADSSGVALSGNTTANPQFADPNYEADHNYQVASTSPAASWGMWNGDVGSAASASFPVASAASLGTVSAPSVPRGLKAVASGRKVVLTWKANAAGNHVRHYNVYRTDQRFKRAWATPTTTRFTNTGSVDIGKRYCYRLSATNRIGTGAKSAQVCVTVLSAKAAAARAHARRHRSKTWKRPARHAGGHDRRRR